MAAQGWGQPMRAGKPHYFVDGTSLCGCWDCYGGPLEDGRARPGLDCAVCVRRFNKGRFLPAEAVVYATATSLTYNPVSEAHH